MRNGKIPKILDFNPFGIMLIIILPLFLLGLGVGIIKGCVQEDGPGSAISLDYDKMNKIIKDDLFSSNQLMAMLDSDFSLKKGMTYNTMIGVNNNRNNSMSFNIQIQDINTNSSLCTEIDGKYKSTNTRKGIRNDCAAFFWNSTLQALPPGKISTYKLKIFTPKVNDTFMYKAVIMPEGEETEYASQTFFITTEQR